MQNSQPNVNDAPISMDILSCNGSESNIRDQQKYVRQCIQTGCEGVPFHEIFKYILKFYAM